MEIDETVDKEAQIKLFLDTIDATTIFNAFCAFKKVLRHTIV